MPTLQWHILRVFHGMHHLLIREDLYLILLKELFPMPFSVIDKITQEVVRRMMTSDNDDHDEDDDDDVMMMMMMMVVMMI
jgi:hypothetical protein